MVWAILLALQVAHSDFVKWSTKPQHCLATTELELRKIVFIITLLSWRGKTCHL